MAITIRNIDGTTPWASATNPNSVRLGYDAGTSAVDLMAAVDTFVQAHGWTYVDKNAGATIYSYSQSNSYNTQGTANKYMVLDASSGTEIKVISGSGLTGTPQITASNISYDSNTAANGQRISSTLAGDLFISCGAGWFAMFGHYDNFATRGSSIANNASAILEVFVDSQDFPVTATPFVSLTGAVFNASTTISWQANYCTPITYYGGTGAQRPGIVLSSGWGGYMYTVTNLPQAILGGFPGADYFTAKTKAVTVSLFQMTGAGGGGARYIGKVVRGQLVGGGTYLDTATLKITDGQIDPGGTSTEHLLFPFSNCTLAVPI